MTLIVVNVLSQDMENKIRSTLNEIYFGKTKDIVNGLRYCCMSCLCDRVVFFFYSTSGQQLCSSYGIRVGFTLSPPFLLLFLPSYVIFLFKAAPFFSFFSLNTSCFHSSPPLSPCPLFIFSHHFFLSFLS